MRQSWVGVTLVLMSSVAFSSAGYFTRLIPLDVWTMLFWRCLFGGLFIALCVLLHHRGRVWEAWRGLGVSGLLIALCSTVSTLCFINALRLTSVADVNVIFATAPFVSAGLAWAFTGTRESRATLAASSVALLGVAIMVDAAVTEGHWLGDLLALVMTVLLAAMMVMIRHRKPGPALPAASLSAFLAALAVLPWAHPLAVGRHDMGLLVLFGVSQFGLGLALLTVGTRLISATRAALLSALEMPFAIAWVWIGLSEAPTLAATVGGTVVMGAVLGDLLWQRRGLR
ncbi:MAG: DMT family transporter [Acetobacteraceae bacterium]|nr:DMT family transporter [Acetobacteraceae bacterium]